MQKHYLSMWFVLGCYVCSFLPRWRWDFFTMECLAYYINNPRCRLATKEILSRFIKPVHQESLHSYINNIVRHIVLAITCLPFHKNGSCFSLKNKLVNLELLICHIGGIMGARHICSLSGTPCVLGHRCRKVCTGFWFLLFLSCFLWVHPRLKVIHYINDMLLQSSLFENTLN